MTLDTTRKKTPDFIRRMIPDFIRGKLILFMLTTSLTAQPFVRVDGTRFIRGDSTYYFLGTNLWYGMHLAAATTGNRQRLLSELDQLQSLGITNLRVMAAGEGPDTAPWRVVPSLQPQPGEYNEELLEGLDFLLSEMGKRQMTAVLCLNNFWHWSGGFAQYVNWYEDKPIPYPPPAEDGSWFTFSLYSSRFYKNKKALAAFERYIRSIVQRVNSYTGLAYRDDPTIMAWQLANEPRGILRPRAYRRWIRRSASLIKSLDKNHLVSIGSEGNTSAPTGNHFYRDHRYRHIDYTTVHVWIQNWGWYDPQNGEQSYPKAWEKTRQYLQRHLHKAQKLNKPLVLEEFGIARDGGAYDTEATTAQRDRFYGDVFGWLYEKAAAGEAIAGGNFWAWAGRGRPRKAYAIWQYGDELIGDPPHEHQGWYSVYNRDKSTLSVIRAYAEKMEGLCQTVSERKRP